MKNSLSQPIRGQYSGHVVSLDQLEASVQVKWSVLTNKKPVFLCQPIRGQYSGHVICLDQSEASIKVTWFFKRNQILNGKNIIFCLIRQNIKDIENELDKNRREHEQFNQDINANKVTTLAKKCLL